MFNADRIYGIYRQASNITFTIVKTDPAHDKLEEEYRSIRSQISFLIDNINTLKDSEHGGPALKTIKENYHKMKGTPPKTGGKDYSDNMYDVASNIFHNLSLAYESKTNKQHCQDLEKLFANLSDEKHKFNLKLGEINENLKCLRSESEDIDNLRTKMKNIQFDAENKANKIKKQFPDVKYEEDPGFKAKKQEFLKLEENVKKRMKEFIDNEKHEKSFKSLMNAFDAHHKNIK